MGVEECHRSGGCPYPTDCVYWRKCRITDRPAASSPDEPRYAGACQVTSTSGVCVLGTAGCITRHIVEALRCASSPDKGTGERHRNTWDGSCSRCGMGNEYVDQHAPDCPASADEVTRQRPPLDPYGLLDNPDLLPLERTAASSFPNNPGIKRVLLDTYERGTDHGIGHATILSLVYRCEKAEADLLALRSADAVTPTPSPDPERWVCVAGTDTDCTPSLPCGTGRQRLGCHYESPAAAAGEGTERPGGWVPELGAWIAWLRDLDPMDMIWWGPTDPATPAGDHQVPETHDEAVRVVRWADGSTPQPPVPPQGTERPDTAALLTIGDWLLRTLPGHQGAEQTAATLAYTARWIDAQPPAPPQGTERPGGRTYTVQHFPAVPNGVRTFGHGEQWKFTATEGDSTIEGIAVPDPTDFLRAWADAQPPVPPSPAPPKDPRVCEASSTRPPEEAREPGRRYRLTCPTCGRNVGMVGGFIARHHRKATS